ncbi:MAG: fructose-6-phosphate aldolase [Planctomycetota bacterium]
MKIFLDTANLEEIKIAKEDGFLDGVTTNPTLLSKECKNNPKEHLLKICEVANVPTSAEVLATDWEGMIEEGLKLSRLSAHIVIKLPLTRDGLKAARILLTRDVKVNVTLCFSSNQALLVAKIGATYVSPFIGRLDDRGHDGMQIIEEIRTIYRNYGFKTQILVASIRHPVHVLKSALAGADCATMPFAVYEKLFHHPLTEIGLQQFADDWKKTGLATWNL